MSTHEPDRVIQVELDNAKRGLRRTMREHVNAARSDLGDAGDRIVDLLLDHEVWSRSRAVMAYLGSRSEIVLDRIWQSRRSSPERSEAGRSGRVITAPRVDWGSASMTPLTIDDLAEQTEIRLHGIREPLETCEPIAPSDLDLVLVPGVAFDPFGGRLGRGGGFYDRFLPSASGAVLVGVCWSAQVLPRVPAGPQDVRVHMLLTEHGLQVCGPTGDVG